MIEVSKSDFPVKLKKSLSYKKDSFASPRQLYVAAKKAGFTSFEEFDKAFSAGFQSREEWVNAKEQGFPTAETFYHAKKMGLTTYNEYAEAVEGRFKNADEYHKAKKLGFKNNKDFQDAMRGGFKDFDEYQKAIELGITERQEYLQYLEKKEFMEKYGLQNDLEIKIFKVIKDMRHGLQLSILRLLELTGYYNPQRDRSPSSEIIQKTEEILQTHPTFKQLGFYEPMAQIFQLAEEGIIIPTALKSLEDFEGVVIDGSNVAWEGRSKKEGQKATIDNLELVLKALQDKGVTNVIIIVDASLRHQLEEQDIETYEKWVNEGLIKQVPAGTDADYFIITHAQKTSSLIITNDKFSDWKEENPDKANLIEQMRVGFFIANETVTFDEKLENWLKVPK